MRKLFFGIFCVTLALFIGTIAIAQEIESSPSASASPTPKPSVEYFLPYPGLLPDHPLYPIKVLRDRIVGILTADPVKRIEFNLLMADKRLNMGIFLSEKGKEELAESTISKGEKYLQQAVDQFAALFGKEKELGALLDQLKKSTDKHKEVITTLREKAEDTHQKGYQSSLDLLDKSTEILQGL